MSLMPALTHATLHYACRPQIYFQVPFGIYMLLWHS